MSNDLNTSRWSVSTRVEEKDEIAEYTSKTGVSRNELMRRATLAYIRKQDGKKGTIEDLFQSVGPIDLVEAKI